MATLLPGESEAPAGKARVAWIDSLRGVGIVFVVAGHVVSDPLAWHYIFLFHMPLFFALSGYMFARTEPRELIQRRIMTLLVPYAAYLVTLTVIDWGLCALDGREPSLPLSPLYMFVLRVVYGGNLLHGAPGVLWFLTCLFMTNVLFALAAWRYGPASSRRMVMLAVGMLVLAYLMPPLRAPLAVAQVPFAYFMFWAGALYRQLPLEPRWTWIVVAAITVPCFLTAPDVDVKYMKFGVPWLNIPAALGACYLLLHLVRVLDRVPVWTRCSGELGRAAMVIFAVHYLLRQHLIGLMPEWLVIVLSTLVPYLFYRAAMLVGVGRVMFLGLGKPPGVLVRFFDRRFPRPSHAASI